MEQLARAVREREGGESATAALRRAYLAAVAERDPVVGFSGRPFAEMIVGSQALIARLREFHEARGAALAWALAEEACAAPDDIAPRIAAALLAGVRRVLFEETMRRTLVGESDEEIATALARCIGEAFDAVEMGLGSRWA
ncbi:hypothetical protein [Myceligenerans halotolerans]